MVISAVSKTAEVFPPMAAPTPVLKLYRPVKIPARVGEQNGFDQAFLKRTPVFSKRLTLGRFTVSR